MNTGTRTKPAPSVSVLIPIFNAARTLPSALGSILRQTRRAFEIVLVDDGSTDASSTVIAAYARRDERIQVVERPNGGIVAALNDGWQMCTGDYIARMDSDDISLPWRLACQVAYMERNPDVVASGTGMAPFQSSAPFIGVPVQLPQDATGIRTRLLFNPPIMHPTAIFRRAALLGPPPYSSTMPQAEDFELWSRLGKTHRLGNISTISLLYRRSITSISSSRREEQMRQAGDLRLQNLARVLDENAVCAYAELHLELMYRRHAPTSLIERLPAYVDLLLDHPMLSPQVIEQVWFGYCLSYARAGSDGAGLFRRVKSRRRPFRESFLSLARRPR